MWIFVKVAAISCAVLLSGYLLSKHANKRDETHPPDDRYPLW